MGKKQKVREMMKAVMMMMMMMVISLQMEAKCGAQMNHRHSWLQTTMLIVY
jgi:hypothetical protein